MQNIYTESCPLWDRGPSRYSEYPACTQTVLSDKITENTKEKGRREHMSFVGLTFFKDRIIGYGDTKGSCFIDGKLQEDKERGKIPKVFTTKDFIICTYGINSFEVVGDKTGEIFIENWLEDNIGKVNYPEDLVKRLHEYLLKEENLLALNEQLHFIAGYIEMGQRVLVRASVNKMELSIKREYVTIPLFAYGGNDAYVQYFNKDTIQLMSDEEDIKKNIERAVKKFDRELPYNPVGGDIIVKTWSPQK